jgi:penicillin-insensitive murein endopeptidase
MVSRASCKVDDVTPLSIVLALVLADSAAPDGGVRDADVAIDAAPVQHGFDPRWSQVSSPSPGPPRSIGLPGAGCVQGAAKLPRRSPDYVVVPRGGPASTGHRSHQSGLDVDLWYGPSAKRLVPGKSVFPPSVVDLRTKKMLPAWNGRPARLLELAASWPSVDRIFVHPAVKRALCEDKTKRGTWLGKLRPWWGHQDHFHVRLRCPSDSPDCTSQPPLGAGDGCDASLNWWFSTDAQKAAAKRGPPGEGAPAMPEECERVLNTKG